MGQQFIHERLKLVCIIFAILELQNDMNLWFQGLPEEDRNKLSTTASVIYQAIARHMSGEHVLNSI